MELTIEQALKQGVAAHKAGKFQEAERLYRAILQSEPSHPDANHNLGVLAVSVNKADAALPLFKTALEANPKIEQFWLSYIDALIKENQLETVKKVLAEGRKMGLDGEKVDALEEQLKQIAQSAPSKLSEQKKKGKSKNPNSASPSQSQLNNLIEQYQNGQYDEAEKLAVLITQQFPEHQFAWKVLGAVLGQTGRKSEAVNANQKAVELSPQDAEAHSNLGNTLHDLGRLDEAEASLRQAIALKPDYAEAHSNLGNTLKELGRLDEAEASLRQAIALKPDYAKVHYNLGNTLREQGRLDEAEASYMQAIALKPDLAEAHNNLGNTLKELGRLDEAEASYMQAIALKPDYAKAHSNLGNTLKELGRLDEAEASYMQAIALKPDYAKAHSNLGNTLKELGRLDEAEASLRQAIALKPDLAEAHSNLGNTLKELGRLDEAEASYMQAIALKPDYAEAHSNLGNTLKELGRLDEAEASYMQAIALKPDLAEAHNNLGNTLKELGRLDEAEASYMQAIALKPDLAEAHSNLGNTLKELGRLDEAEASYMQAIALKPDYAEAHSNLGNTLKELGRLDEAEASYMQAIALKPDYAEAHSNLGNTLKELGRLDEAEASYMQAIALKPDYAEAHNNLGNTLHDLGRSDEAEASLRQAIALKPDLAEAYSNLGITLHKLGKLEEAIKAYYNALSIKPDFPKAWNNIAFPLQAIKTKISPNDKLRSLYPEDTNSKHAQIEKSILNYKLHLGGKNAENSLNEALSPLARAENITIKNPAGNKVAAGLDLRLPDKVIAMMNFGRSGTGLLHSLIDGHSEVSTIPSIYLSQYFLHSNWEKIISGGWGEMANRFVAIYEVLFNAASTVPIEILRDELLHNIGQKEGMANVGDHQNEVLSVDKKLFRAELNRLMGFYDELDAFVFFKLVHAAYDNAINDLNQKNLLFYHIHNPDTYAQLNFLRSAPDGRGLIMVREPVQSCESWSSELLLDNKYAKVVPRISTMLFQIDSIVYHKCNSIGVRLEDIKESPRQTISALCKWMGIKEAESLYEMTAQSKKWWGDPSSQDFKKDGMDPFGKTSINRKVGSIFSEKDQFILRTLYYPFSVRFGYVQANFEQFKVDLQAIRPMLDQMFDFEKALVKRTQVNPKQLMKSGSYLYLRSGLVERWNTLNEFHTYPNMIEPLRIVSE